MEGTHRVIHWLAWVYLPGEHSRLLPEPDLGVEVPLADPGGQADRTLLQGALPGKT